MNDTVLHKLSSVSDWLYKLWTALFALLSIGVGFYKGFTSHSTPLLIAYATAGAIGALIIALTFVALNFGMAILDRSTSWLSKHIRKYPHIRLWLILPSVLLAFFAAYLVIRYLEIDLSLRILLALYLVWVWPAALTSLVRDDMVRERSLLSQKLSRDMRIKNPQAAIENAFTYLEDRLMRRIPDGGKLYGHRLIDAAYSGTGSRLVYRCDGKDQTAHLRDLMSGAYSMLRNPRHHKIVEDDERKAQIIIPFVELLIEFVDLSEDRDS